MKNMAHTRIVPRFLIAYIAKSLKKSKPLYWRNAARIHGTLRAYFYPHIQRQKSVSGIQRVYSEKTDYYNNRVHWEFRNDDVKTPLGMLGSIKGRSMPDDFELSFLATGKRYTRTVDRQGRISWKRYGFGLYVRAELRKEKRLLDDQ